MLFQDNSHRDVFILAEHRDGVVDPLTFQMAVKGREIADKLGCQLNALLLGCQLDLPAKQLQDKGFDRVYVLEHQLLMPYNTEIYAKVICDFLKVNLPGVLLLGYSYLGMELGPVIANRLDMAYASNCVDLEIFEDQILVTRPMYGGRVYVHLETKKLPVIVSIQKGVFPSKNSETKLATVTQVDIDSTALETRTRILKLLARDTGGIDITKANLLVAVGRGIGNKANIELAYKLADALNGTVCGSRPITEMGWLPHECHVGISGRTVHPKVYIACGISGASQHISGMRDSQMIIAINKDPNAPIFRIAHCGVVGDLFEIIPSLLEDAAKDAVVS